MTSRLWYMNADFEFELAAWPGAYRPRPTIARTNRRLAPLLLWLAQPGDALLFEEPWPEHLRAEAARREIELLDPGRAAGRGNRVFTPWGWTPSAVELGERLGAAVDPIPVEVEVRVNSKLFSHALERELGIAVPGAALASTLDELDAAAACACPGSNDKWVVKSPLGVAARERVLGRGPALDAPSAKWAARRLAAGELLLFEPWLEVVREYGVLMHVEPDGRARILGISDQQTNGAGTATGFLLGRAIAPDRAEALARVAATVAARLAGEGYRGPASVDALEHAGGLRPLLEINARYTMGFVALAVERHLRPAEPVCWRGGNE